jgi:hypothetical protein
MHLGHSPSRVITPYSDLVARIIGEGRLRCVQFVGQEQALLQSHFLFSFFLLLFIYTYNVWVISPPFPRPLPCPLPPPFSKEQQN